MGGNDEVTYLLFAGHSYYPKGGIKDLRARGTVEELKAIFLRDAKKIADGQYIDNWGQIVNASTLEVVLEGRVERTANSYSTPGVTVWNEPNQESTHG